MHSIINFKLWKKCIKRFSKKVKPGDSSCSKSGNVQKSVAVLESGTSCEKSTFEQLSLYSIDSLEEKKSVVKKYGCKQKYNPQCTKKSESLESILTSSSIRSDISEDSLQIWSLSKESLAMRMKVCIENMSDSLEKLKIKGNPNKLLHSKYQTRDRSHTIGQSYQLEKSFDKSGQKFIAFNQLHNFCKMSSSNEVRGLATHETISIDSLENSTGRLYSLNKQFISEDSFNEPYLDPFNKFNNTYKNKSISDGVLNETEHFKRLLCNRDFVVLDRILLNEIKKKYNIANKLPKYYHDQPNLISLIDLQCSENYENAEEKMSIDSLSVPQSEIHMNYSSGYTELCIKRKKTVSPRTFPCENSSIQNCKKLNGLKTTKIHQFESHELETQNCYSYRTNNDGDRKSNVNDYNFKISCNDNSYSHNSMHLMEIGKYDTFSIDSLCDSLN